MVKRISFDMKTPYAGDQGMLSQMKEKLTIQNESPHVCRKVWSLVFLYYRSLSIGPDMRLTS